MNFEGVPFSQDKIPSGLSHQYKYKLKEKEQPQVSKRDKEGGSQRDKIKIILTLKLDTVSSSYKLGAWAGAVTSIWALFQYVDGKTNSQEYVFLE